MSYCPHCGSEIDREITPEEKEERALIEIERIRADKEITLAKLAAKAHDAELDTTEHVADVQAETDVATATVEAEVIAAGIAAGVEPEPEPEPTQVIVQNTEPEPEPEMPERAEHREPRDRKPSNYFGF